MKSKTSLIVGVLAMVVLAGPLSILDEALEVNTGPKVMIGGGGPSIQVPAIYTLSGYPVFTIVSSCGNCSFYKNDAGEIVEVNSGPKVMIGGGVPIGWKGALLPNPGAGGE